MNNYDFSLTISRMIWELYFNTFKQREDSTKSSLMWAEKCFDGAQKGLVATFSHGATRLSLLIYSRGNKPLCLVRWGKYSDPIESRDWFFLSYHDAEVRSSLGKFTNALVTHNLSEVEFLAPVEFSDEFVKYLNSLNYESCKDQISKYSEYLKTA